ncbi:FAD-binding oxidoreductase [Dactylosporangium siamense]|uniref:Flavohemoprotein n=2 Tax=Dactylosporangium siamense TaxID=685454 RepID=A0A919PUU8_9ACTN|nr:flavohemoprotein [Dactylosporangium siamense]
MGAPVEELRALLPGEPGAQREVLRDAVGWLVAHVDQPQVLAARCAELGPVVAQLGVAPQRLENLAVLFVDMLRANPPGVVVRRDQEEAWATTGRLVSRWMADGAAAGAHEPASWSATVVRHERRRADAAVVAVRTYLPYPCLPGQLAVVESSRLPGRWRRCWVGNVPAGDNVVELHVVPHRADPAGAELVERTGVGDVLRLRPAVGVPAVDPGATRPLLVVAARDAVAPVRALLGALRAAGDRRAVTVFWPAAVERDLYRLADLAPEGTVVIRDRFAAGDEDWTRHDAFAAGDPATVAGTLPRIEAAGVPADRVRTAVDGPGDA